MKQKGGKPKKGPTASFAAAAGTTTQTTAGQRIGTTTTRTTATTTTGSESSNSLSFGIMTDVLCKTGNRPVPEKDEKRKRERRLVENRKAVFLRIINLR